MLIKNSSTPHVIKNILLSKKEPVSVVHFVTNRCNARCSFCFIKQKEHLALHLFVTKCTTLTGSFLLSKIFFITCGVLEFLINI